MHPKHIFDLSPQIYSKLTTARMKMMAYHKLEEMAANNICITFYFMCLDVCILVLSTTTGAERGEESQHLF